MKSKVYVSLLLAPLLYGCVHSGNNTDSRSYGGHPVDITNAPYVVYIAAITFANGELRVEQCTGSILRKNLILTAAHCVVTPDGTVAIPSFVIVTSGSNTTPSSGGTGDGGRNHIAKNVFVHPQYNGGGNAHFFHDVSLIELQDDIQLNARSQLVTLANRSDDPQVGADVVITGYGDKPDHPDDDRLYQVELKVISAERCQQEVAGGTVQEIGKHQICSAAEGKNQCKGDSGGPLHDASTNRQVGIVSYGAENCTSGKPSIQARVTDNLDFINEIIQRTTTNSESQPDSKPTQMTYGAFWNHIMPTPSRYIPRN